MALKKCRACGNQISIAAKSCPQCGHVEKDAISSAATVIKWILAAPIILAVGFCSFAGGSLMNKSEKTTASPKEATVEKLQSEAFLAVATAQVQVAKRLKDPDSAKFGNVYAVANPAGGILVCGQVNAKNSFGGYSGMKNFMWDTESAVMQEDMEASKFRVAWAKSCGKWEVI